MEACKVQCAEIHNQRGKELTYVRVDLVKNNSQKILWTIHDRMAHIKKTYQEAMRAEGKEQKMQASARPIQEVVLLINEHTTMADVERFGRLCLNRLGMTPLQYYIHADEGHYAINEDGSRGDWIPNYHAHIIFDTLCYDRSKKVLRTKKINGKNVKDEHGKPVKIEISGYGKTIKFTRADMSLMQDLAAEATGMQRGVKSNKEHLSAIDYKIQQRMDELLHLDKSIGTTTIKVKAAAAEVGKQIGLSIVDKMGISTAAKELVKAQRRIDDLEIRLQDRADFVQQKTDATISKLQEEIRTKDQRMAVQGKMAGLYAILVDTLWPGFIMALKSITEALNASYHMIIHSNRNINDAIKDTTSTWKTDVIKALHNYRGEQNATNVMIALIHKVIEENNPIRKKLLNAMCKAIESLTTTEHNAFDDSIGQNRNYRRTF